MKIIEFPMRILSDEWMSTLIPTNCENRRKWFRFTCKITQRVIGFSILEFWKCSYARYSSYVRKCNFDVFSWNELCWIMGNMCKDIFFPKISVRTKDLARNRFFVLSPGNLHRLRNLSCLTSIRQCALYTNIWL